MTDYYTLKDAAMKIKFVIVNRKNDADTPQEEHELESLEYRIEEWHDYVRLKEKFES